MRNCWIIIKKQFKDTIKNKPILIQFILFPILTIVMETAIKLDGMPELYFTKLFSVMYMGMAPLVATATIIAEEKEKNTLRVLMMANVKPVQYLIGAGLYVWIICMCGAGLMSVMLKSEDIPFYLTVMAIGFIISIAAGAWIGVYAKNQMVATSMVMPAMIVFSFAPMLAMFNDGIEKVARFFYTQQLRTLLDLNSFEKMKTGGIIILAVNAVVMIAAFFVTFKRKGLE